MNSIVIAGRIGKDAEQKYTDSGESVVNFSVAVSKGKNKETQWFRCALWGKYGETLFNYLTKGTSVAVQGELSARTYTSQGKSGVSLDVNARQVTLLGGGQERQPEETSQEVVDNSFEEPTPV